MSSIPISKEGFQALEQELDRLKKERPHVIQAIKEAREEGDLKENAGYDAARERQGMLEARIKYIESRMALFNVIDLSTLSSEKAIFGATVTVEDADTGEEREFTLLGPDAPEIGEGVYFQPEPFDDEVMGLLADALTLRGIGAYAYALVDSSLGGELADIALFTRVGDMFPRYGRHILLTRMYIHRTPTGAGNKAVTWAFGSPADLEEANRLLSEKFDTEPVTDPRGMAAIEIRHPEFAAGTAEPMVLLDEIFQVLGAAGFDGITMCNDPGQPQG